MKCVGNIWKFSICFLVALHINDDSGKWGIGGDRQLCAIHSHCTERDQLCMYYRSSSSIISYR